MFDNSKALICGVFFVFIILLLGAFISCTQPTSIEPPGGTNAPTAAPTAVPTRDPGTKGSQAGDVWIMPAAQTVLNGTTNVKVVVHANTGTSLLAAYGVVITYDPSILGSPVAAQETTGFMSAANVGTPGTTFVSGFDTNGIGPSSDIGVYNIQFKAIGAGTSVIDVTVKTYIDPATYTIGTPYGFGGTITVN